LAAFHATGIVYYKTHPDGEEKLAQDNPFLFSKRFMGGVPLEVSLKAWLSFSFHLNQTFPISILKLFEIPIQFNF